MEVLFTALPFYILLLLRFCCYEYYDYYLSKHDTMLQANFSNDFSFCIEVNVTLVQNNIIISNSVILTSSFVEGTFKKHEQ